MKASVNKRLSWIELALAHQVEPEAVVIDFSVFSDEDLDRLEVLADRLHSWTGDDWLECGLSSSEREELDELMTKVN